MERRFGKILLLLLTSIITVSIVTATPITVDAVSNETFEQFRQNSDFKYAVNSDGTATITEYKANNTNITIPKIIDGYKVTSIGDWAFYNCDSLETVVISSGIKRIGTVAFSSCDNLKKVYIPKSVTTIDVCAFAHSESLQEITIPNGVISIGESAFYDCTSLTSVNISKSVTTIGDDAFADCTSLTNISVSKYNNYFTTVDDVLFNKDKTNLIQYPIANKNTFYAIPDTVTKIGTSAFSFCESLESVIIPNSVTEIETWAFEYCQNLESITLLSSAITVADDAFDSCSKLTTIFGYTGNYAETYANENNYTFINLADFTYKKLDDGTIEILRYVGDAENVIIPKFIDGYKVTSIGVWAFPSCQNLKRIKIPNSVTSIGNYAFYNCMKLREITIPDSVTFIGDGAFYNCLKLKEINIPSSVTSMGVYLFACCPNLEKINVDKNNEYYSDVDGVLFNKDKTTIISYPGGNKNISYTIPNTITSIGYYVFSNCRYLTSVTIPISVKSISNCAFDSCSKLTSITVHDSVKSIGENAIICCPNFKTIYGGIGSSAEIFAIKKGYTFVDIYNNIFYFDQIF